MFARQPRDVFFFNVVVFLLIIPLNLFAKVRGNLAFTCDLSNIFNNSYPLSGFIALSLVMVSNPYFSDPCFQD